MTNNLSRYGKIVLVLIGMTFGLVIFQNFTYTLTAMAPGSDNSIVVARGQILGSCLYQYDANFQVTTTPPANEVHWPMTSCDSAGTATCAAGYTVVKDAPVQMNCSPTPSSTQVNCYWNRIRCASAQGSINAVDFVRGQNYGGCLRQFGGDFKPMAAPESITWPMLTCGVDGNATCAEGFKPVHETPVQMNCSSAPSKTNFQSCFFMATRCAKL